MPRKRKGFGALLPGGDMMLSYQTRASFDRRARGRGSKRGRVGGCNFSRSLLYRLQHPRASAQY